MSLRRHIAAKRGILGVCERHRDELVAAFTNFAQVNVLNRIVRATETQWTTRAVNLRGAHGRNHFIASARITSDRAKSGLEQRGGVVALNRIDVAILTGLLFE